jgi:hypothetical protein
MGFYPFVPASSGATSVTAGDGSLVISPTTGAVIAETGTLDVIAADHPAAANWSNNSFKITSLANGTAASDAAAFGQLPVLYGAAGTGAAGLGMKMLTVPPLWLSTSSSSTANFAFFVLVTAVVTGNITVLGAMVSTAAVTAGVNASVMGIYAESGGAALATATATTALESTGPAEVTITSTAVTAGTNYYLALYTDFTGTVPVITASGSAAIAPTVLNGHYLAGHLTGQTGLPSLTPSSLVLDAKMICLYAR